MSTDPLAEDRMFVAEELRDALAETTLSYGDRNRAAWALVDWLAAHDAQVRADERQKVAARLADEGTVEKVAEALGRHREDSTYPDSCVCEAAIPDRPNGRHYPGHAARAALDALTELIGGDE